MRKLLFHSNAPYAPTGYGQQCGLFAPLLKDRYDIAISCFYGLEGSPMKWEGMRLLPGLGGEFGNDTLPAHAERFFGSARGGIVLTLMDVWPLDPEAMRGLNMACWVPIDHRPAPPKVVEFFVRSEAIPIAMTRFGERELGRLDPLYVPHGIDTQSLCPRDQAQARAGSFPDGAFVVGMVAANKGRPSRKGFAQALMAFAKFAQQHENAFMYLHTTLAAEYGNGENLSALVTALDIPQDRLRIADQYALMYEPHSHDEMAQIYSAMDVLLAPSLGEGFGLPILEAASCGVPSIVTDWSAMPEVQGTGWTVKHVPYWTALSSWQAIPDVDDIVSALEECYRLKKYQREKMAVNARKHAVKYDVRRVFQEHMMPALRTVEQRFDSRKPVRIPSRLKVAA